MAATTMLQTANVELSSIPQAPTKAVPRTYPAVPQYDDPSLANSPSSNVLLTMPTVPRDGYDHDIELSSPGIPNETESSVPAVEVMPSISNPPRNKYRFMAICVQAFINGLADSAPGALIPYMERYYNIGYAIVSLIATSIVTRVGAEAWHEFYYLTIGLALAVAVFFAWSFAGYESESETTAAEGSQQPQPQTQTQTASSSSVGVKAQLAAMARALRSRVVILGSIFIFSYQGGEVSISGWVISFLITARGGDPATVGNVTSGFWGGITLGRLALSPLGARIGERRFVYCITVGAAVFELLVWLVPNIVGEAVSLAVVGLLLGPVYPCATTVLTRGLSRTERLSGIGVVSAFGSTGGAVAPFLTGLLAQLVGTYVLHPIAISLFAVMLICWYLLPPVQKKTD